MSASSSSSDSEGSSTGDEMPKVTTHTERVIRRYQIKKSLILERMFAIEQVRTFKYFLTYVKLKLSYFTTSQAFSPV